MARKGPFIPRTINLKMYKNSRVHSTTITIMTQRNGIVGITFIITFFPAD